MKVLWLCNVMMPMIAEQLQLEASNKEGWLSGLATVALERKNENGIELGIAFPAPAELLADGRETFEKSIAVQGATLNCYGFREDVTRPEVYDEGLEKRMQEILCCLWLIMPLLTMTAVPVEAPIPFVCVPVARWWLLPRRMVA